MDAIGSRVHPGGGTAILPKELARGGRDERTPGCRKELAPGVLREEFDSGGSPGGGRVKSKGGGNH